MNTKLKEILSTSLYFLCVIVFTFLLIKFVGQRSIVIGTSMYPTLNDGDNLIMNKIGYHLHAPERFDIAIFPFRDGSDNTYIKRIIGLPGETVRIDMEGNIYINDVLLAESYGREVIKEPGNALYGVTLGDDEYYVLGDNRNRSSDSRFSEVGIVKRDEIIGKAWLRFWPFNSFGRVDKKK